MNDKFRLINCNSEIDNEPKAEEAKPIRKLLYLGLDDSATNAVLCPFRAQIVNMCRTMDQFLLNELVETDDIKHIWGTIHAILDRAVANNCYGIILPVEMTKISYFIFGVVHSSYPSIYFYTLAKDESGATYLVQIS